MLAQGLAPQLAGLLTIQSGHDSLAQRKHQPQRGTKEEEARDLEVKTGAGALCPITAPCSLCLLSGLQAGTVEMKRDGIILGEKLYLAWPSWPGGAAGSRGASGSHLNRLDDLRGPFQLQ